MDLSFLFNDYVMQVATNTGINIIMVLGLNLITGVTGQLSLGHAAFMSIGAYSSAILSTSLGAPFIVSLVTGTLTGAIFGAILGIPILRLRGDYLAISTLGFGEIIRVILLNTDLVGGALGIYNIPDSTNIYIVFIAVAFAIFFMYRLEKSRHGMAIKSIREDEIASEMMGINIARYKIISFTIGSGFAALGGTLYAHFMTYINPVDFGFMKSIEQLCMLVLGGMGSIFGAVAGTIVLSTIPEFLRFASEYRMLTYGIVLILMMIFRPQGLFGKIKVNV
ncbi:MAG: branched-chain amino acid ABC transporter permease [Calditerrivibrio sp.]|nr:branched-chain amino acid ABC transporter permease [Calditerrivibrio sp.]